MHFATQRDESALSEGVVNGIIKTRVGYTGGKGKNPNYQNVLDFTEALQIWYDGKQETYSNILDQFFEKYDPRIPRENLRRYVIFYQNEEQRELAIKKSIEYNKKVSIEPLNDFYLAEPYHQKYSSQEMKNEWKLSPNNFTINTRNWLMSTKYYHMYDFNTFAYQPHYDDEVINHEWGLGSTHVDL